MKRMIQGESLIRKATKCSFILSIMEFEEIEFQIMFLLFNYINFIWLLKCTLWK